ncbi:hypothetical protein TcCL_Unassigned02031 [Trypanosoma cruzi]|nr:hypothetical protein TcCL_Unassigned02031 [Trypanosoma cruzi]
MLHFRARPWGGGWRAQGAHRGAPSQKKESARANSPQHSRMCFRHLFLVFARINPMARAAGPRVLTPRGATAAPRQCSAGSGAGRRRQPCANKNIPFERHRRCSTFPTTRATSPGGRRGAESPNRLPGKLK